MSEEITDGIAQLKGFPGQYRDEETGYADNWNRTYDPSIGRYVQSDSAGLGGGLNTYGYAGGNPLSHMDPLGQVAQGTVIGGTVGGLIGGVAGGLGGAAACSMFSIAGTISGSTAGVVAGAAEGSAWGTPLTAAGAAVEVSLRMFGTGVPVVM